MTSRTKYRITSNIKYAKHKIKKTVRSIIGKAPRCGDCMFCVMCNSNKNDKICEGFLD